MKQELKALPVSKSDLGIILSNNMLYVDKTKYVYDLIKVPGSYFLSRPRRFGKSMLLSTFEKVFQGKKELFSEQWIYSSDWEWDTYPIIRLDFNIAADTDLKHAIKNKLRLIAIDNDVFVEKEFESTLYDEYFEIIIRKLAKLNEYNQVVVLIDEYDKPILDNLDNVAIAEEKREVLKGFYTVMKGLDDYLRFVFLTGVSRFSKVGIFSGLNNLNDISMDSNYAAVCGITQDELEFYCKDYIELLAGKECITYEDCVVKIKHWYNGFCFSRNGVSVYNPYSTMNILVKREFDNYWFSSGNASSVIKLMKKEPDLEMFKFNEYYASLDSFDTFELGNINIIAFLFQAGYLTLKAYDVKTASYILGYPNLEIEKSFKQNVLAVWSRSRASVDNSLLMLGKYLEENKLELVIEMFRKILLNIDYDIKLSQENNYQSIFYLIFQLLGFYIEVEYKTNLGRIDAVVKTQDNIYIFEFKLDKNAKEALEQIKAKSYYDRFVNTGRAVYLIGANFNSEQRNIDEYLIEALA